jgi:hypothetical protein
MPERNIGPKELEARKGHKLFEFSSEVFGEVSRFKGRVYVSIRRWYRDDENGWMRTKNGINLESGRFKELLAQTENFTKFMLEELKNPYESEEERRQRQSSDFD